MDISQEDHELIREAAILAGLIEGGEYVAPGSEEFAALLLREVRNETMAWRLAQRLLEKMPAAGHL